MSVNWNDIKHCSRDELHHGYTMWNSFIPSISVHMWLLLYYKNVHCIFKLSNVVWYTTNTIYTLNIVSASTMKLKIEVLAME